MRRVREAGRQTGRQTRRLKWVVLRSGLVREVRGERTKERNLFKRSGLSFE